MNIEINIGIYGAQGYVGSELLKLVSQHPCLKLSAIVVRAPKAQMPDVKNVPIYYVSALHELEDKIDVLLLATPPQGSIETVTVLKNKNIKIIDLSGAFRLGEADLSHWYGLTHQIPELENGAQYGLSPWGFGNATLQNNVLANPGCYATAALMSLIPLLKNNVIKSNNIIIDAKSGTSGAGKKSDSSLMFSEMSENFFPYKVGKHQHIPEINKALFQYSQKECQVTLMTHMLPISRGISMSIYADGQNEFETDESISKAISVAYDLAYQDYPLLSFAEINLGDAQKDQFYLSLKNVVGTAKTHIAYYVDQGKVYLFTCIDNLLKGAASQAIENINALYHLPLQTGLLSKEESS